VKIGIYLPQEWEKDQIDPIEAYETMTRVAQEAEAFGFNSVWIFGENLTKQFAQLFHFDMILTRTGAQFQVEFSDTGQMGK
jgi:hypothetical protein